MLAAGRARQLVPRVVAAQRGSSPGEAIRLVDGRGAGLVGGDEREPDRGARAQLAESWVVRPRDDGCDRVATGRLVVGEEDERVAAGRELDRAVDDAVAQQFAGAGLGEGSRAGAARALEPQPDAVALRPDPPLR